MELLNMINREDDVIFNKILLQQGFLFCIMMMNENLYHASLSLNSGVHSFWIFLIYIVFI